MTDLALFFLITTGTMIGFILTVYLISLFSQHKPQATLSKAPLALRYLPKSPAPKKPVSLK